MDTFRFANPDILYLLLLVPVLILIWSAGNGRRRLARDRFGDSELVRRLSPDYSQARMTVKFFIRLLAFILALLTVARPQFGSRLEEVKREGVEVIIALDVSNSMLATDIHPSRLERARQAISQLVDQLRNDRIGLILFAGDAYTQIPVTNDYLSAKMFLASAGPDAVSKQGTAIGAAIELGIRSFTPESDKSRALIIITDGENHEDDAVEQARLAAEKGITVHTIGIGSPEGSPIPITASGRTDYLQDREGNTVISKLDEKTLREIASVTGGNYVRASNSSIGLNEIYSDIGRMKKSETNTVMYTEYNDQFLVPAVLLFLLLVADLLLADRRSHLLRRLGIVASDLKKAER
ncbi:MAG: VWA domain-containing protein [Bacteroidales bacterium]|nr:VWA domain-containing protein [Bacteroidales bacterium]MDT8372927.1 VWA domain-containing protein [Bacteroidales bacterium]